jgi:hypothetical protein
LTIDQDHLVMLISPELLAMLGAPGVVPLKNRNDKLLLPVDKFREPSIVSIHVIPHSSITVAAVRAGFPKTWQRA